MTASNNHTFNPVVKRNEAGFSLIAILALLIALGLAGFAGWYIWHSKNAVSKHVSSVKTTPKSHAASKQTTAAPAEKQQFKIPDGYTTYNDKSGFSFAYPAEWGSLTAPTDPNLGYRAATQYLDNKPIGNSWLQGYFGFNVADESSFKINAQKYGATVSPIKSGSGYTWKVVDVNPADTQDKIGDAYIIKTLRSTSGVTLYDFSWQDEGATYSRFAFESKDTFVTISLPPILRQFMEAVPSQDMDAYNTIAHNIQNSVSLSN